MGLSLRQYDALVVGAGPNGLAGAITLARVGRAVLLLEAKDTIGGGCRSAQLTLPGFVHDVCAAFHPLALASPFLRTLPLAGYGLQWIQPPVPLAHPLDGGRAVLLYRSIRDTANALGEDGAAYSRLIAPVVKDWGKLADAILGPVQVRRYPLALLRFGLRALLPARLLAETVFRGEEARALFAGMAAHSMLPLEQAPCASFGLVLAALGHLVGWPLARGGSQSIVDALAAYFRSLGGQITTGVWVRSSYDIPSAPVVLFDVTPRQLLRIVGDRLPPAYRARLRRYRYGPGVFKIDWALDGPIPWAAPECALAGTVHVGGTLLEIAAAERAVWNGQHPARPFVLVGQQSLFDPTRAPTGKQTAWAYCHVPNGSNFDMTGPIEDQIERFAPGFRSRVLARHTMTAHEMHRYNPNYQGGDIAGGVQDLWQLFTRPTFSLVPYRTPAKGIYICSSSTPPGGGVHGMCGYHAAKTALADGF